MDIKIVDRSQALNDKLKSVIEQKLFKLDKYFKEQSVTAKVCLKKQANVFTTEVMLDYAGKVVRATANGENFYDNIDVVLPKLEGQIRKHRTKFDQHQKNSAYKEASVFENVDAQIKSSSLVKQKTFKLKPMTVKEAQEEMELLGHNFYVFLEIKTNTVQVLYLRNDGDLGLIQPQI